MKVYIITSVAIEDDGRLGLPHFARVYRTEKDALAYIGRNPNEWHSVTEWWLPDVSESPEPPAAG